MPERPIRVTVVLTHPIQYFASWFRAIASERPEIELTVLYAVVPTPAAQGAGFDVPFQWDVPLLEGYRSQVLCTAASSAPIASEQFGRFDAAGLDDALGISAPDAVLIPGWHADIYRRAAAWCHAHHIPMIYRGDSNLLTAPAGWTRPLWRVRTRQRLHEYDAWLSVGTAAREYLRAFGVPEPLIFNSPHAVHNAWFAGAAASIAAGSARDEWRHRIGLDAHAFVAMFAGKLVAHKRPLDAIRAIARVPDGQLLIVGAGEMEAACRREAERLTARVVFAGFLNQSELARAYGGVDCLLVPSEAESWGLVINEAMAAGRPAIVTARVGAARDLVEPGQTGEIVNVGDVDMLSAAVSEVRRQARAGVDHAALCRARVASHSFSAATDGLVAACRRLARSEAAVAANAQGAPRVIACCGSMVVRGGLERMTFEVLRTLRQRGAAVHVIVNDWESGPIVTMAEEMGASWSTGSYLNPLSRRLFDPRVVRRSMSDALRTSAGLWRDARAFRPTHVLLPDFGVALRNAPALWWLRQRGARVILRLGNAPTIDRLHRRLWRRVIDPIVDHYVPNSSFIAGEVERVGVPRSKVTVVYNTPSTQPSRGGAIVDPSRVIYVGQVIPPKGVDVLLEAIALVVASGVAVTLDVVGTIDGWESPSYAGYRAHVLARTRQPDLAERVTFLGARDDVAERLAIAAVHCCPSQPEQREGLAGVVLEAKQAGIPSVVTPSGSLPELVRHTIDGWVSQDYSAPAIAEGLLFFLRNDDARRAAGAAAHQSLERFSRERFAAAWSHVFGIDAPPSTSAASTPEQRRAS